MESTLSIPMSVLESEVGEFLGYRRGLAYGERAWTDRQQRNITMCLDSGLRRFYEPEIIPGVCDSSYEWSFLRPVATLTLADGAATVVMPDDFTGVSGSVTLSSENGRLTPELPIVGEGMIRAWYAETPTRTGRPLSVAFVPLKASSVDASQRWEMQVFPIADDDYTIQMAYKISGKALTSANPYAYGGEPHHETILESCLAVAEERIDDLFGGPHAMAFQKRLAASISRDRLLRPVKLGYNGDNSDMRWRRGGGLAARYLPTGGVTYNGSPLT